MPCNLLIARQLQLFLKKNAIPHNITHTKGVFILTASERQSEKQKNNKRTIRPQPITL